MSKQINIITVVAIGLLLIPLTNVEASTRHYEPHLHGTSGSTHHRGVLAGIGFMAGSFYKFHQHKQNPQHQQRIH
jgi:hypothetical protein